MTLYNSKSIAGETVLITGASAGIGRSCALLFAEKGCSLILVARRLEKLQEVERDIISLFPQCSVKLEVCDIASVSDVSDLVTRVKDMQIEVLVNNAGLAIGTHPGDQGPIENTLAMFNTNCIGMIALIRGLSPGMRQRDSGDIVNIGSVAGTDHYAGGAIYCATKAAVEAFSDCLRMDFVDTNIRITEINPGLVSGTEFSLVRFNGDKAKAQIPYQGIACLTPMDIADQAQNTESEKFMRPYILHGHERPVTQVQFSADGELLFTSGKDKNMNVWDAETGELLGTYDHNSAIYGFDVTRDTELLVTCAADGLRIFRVATGELVLFHEIKAIMRSVEWDHDPSGQHRLLTANDNFKDIVPQAVTVWRFDREENSLSKELEITDGFGGKLSQAIWGPFDSELVVLDDCGSLSVYDVKNGDRTTFIDAAHLASLKRGHFSSDYRLFVSAGEDMRVKLWNPVTWTEIATFQSDRILNDAALHPMYRGGKVAACQLPAGISKDADFSHLMKQHIIAGGGQKAADVTTTGAQEGRFEALVFHFVQGEELGRVRGHFGPINSIAWNPSGTGYVSGGEDGYVRLHRFDESYFTDSYWADEE